ncbi:hypothetical protein Tco_1039660 [Tanacetum coccineum]
MAALQYKDDHNKIAYLGRESGSEDFTDILSYLDHSTLRAQLQLDDANGIFDMQIDDILEGMGVIGYPDSPKCGSWKSISHCAIAHKALVVYYHWSGKCCVAHEAAGSTAKAHPAPHSPPFSPVRESTPERQSLRQNGSPQPLFGPAPRPAGYVDPDTIDPIIFGPQPRPYDFVDPALEEPVIFGPPPRPDNYIEPEDIDNLVSMEDDTILGGFHEESPAGPDDAPTPTADAAGRAEDPALLTSLSAKIDRCMGRIDSLETELGTSKKIMGGAILTLVSRVKKLERTVKQLRTARLVGDAPATEGDVDIQDDVDLEGLSRMASEALGHDQAAVPSEDMEEREEEEVPLRRKRSVYRRARTEFHTPAFAQFQTPLSADVLSPAAVSESADPSVVADKGKAHMPDLDIPAEFVAEDAQARQRFEEEQASQRLVQRLQAEDLAQEYMPNVSEERAKELDELMMRMTETDWLNLMMQVGSNPALARELLGADVTEENFVERMTAIKDKKKRALADLRYRALKGKPMKQSECQGRGLNKQLIEEYENICRRLEKDRLLSALYKSIRPACAILSLLLKGQRVARASSQILFCFHPAVQSHPLYGSAAPICWWCILLFLVSTVLLHMQWICWFQHRESGVHICRFLLIVRPITCSLSDHTIDVLFESTSGGINEFFLDSDEDEQIGMSRVAADPDSDDEVLAEIIFRGQSISGHGVVVVDKLPDDEIVDPRVYPIRATLLERMLRHRLTVPPSYCRDVVVAGNVIQTVQAGLRESYECLASVPIACTARQMVFSSPWLTAKKESGSSLQTALVCNSNPLIAEVDINKKTEITNPKIDTKMSMNEKELLQIKAQNGRERPLVYMKNVKTKWAHPSFQQPICVHLDKDCEDFVGQI